MRRHYGAESEFGRRCEQLMRFPVQRFDSASGLNYNYFRDYEVATGRYSQSYLIGLEGGTSTYGYVDGSPMIYVDPVGLLGYTMSLNMRSTNDSRYHMGRASDNNAILVEPLRGGRL